MTGANGYYYIATPVGSIPNGAGVLSYIQTDTNAGTKDGMRVVAAPASGTITALSGLDIWNGAFTVATSNTLFSQGPQSAAQARAVNAALIAQAVGANAGVANFVHNVTGLALITSGTSFTFDVPATAFGNLIVAGAPITVNAPITLNGANTLALLSTGPLPINAPISIADAGAVVLTAQPIAGVSTTGLTFALGASIDYGSAGSRAYALSSLNGTSYKLRLFDHATRRDRRRERNRRLEHHAIWYGPCRQLRAGDQPRRQRQDFHRAADRRGRRDCSGQARRGLGHYRQQPPDDQAVARIRNTA